jgi:CheY-like chemotaxis protein
VDSQVISDEPTPTGLKILVVDDSVDSAKMLAMMLSLDGHEVRTAFASATALEAIKEFSPDAVFLDIGLPIMDGFEVARRMREIRGPRAMLLVAMSGFSQEDDKQRARESGFDHYLVKPADPLALQQLLTRDKHP